MSSTGKFWALAACAAALAGSALQAADVVSVKVKALDGFGGDTGSAVSRCQVRVGDRYDPQAVSRDVSALDASGDFEEVSADAQQTDAGIEVVFLVRRKMRFQAPLVVTGCDYFSESKVASEAGLKDGYLYGEGDLAEAAGKVREAYVKKHFPQAKVTPKATPIPGGDSCTVAFEVAEGPRLKIRDYAFPGAAHVELGDLRKAIGDYPWWNPVGWFNESPKTDDQLTDSVAKAEEVYRNLGYLDVKVAFPKRVEVESGRCDVVFEVTEGPCYTIGNMSIEGLTRYSEAVVKSRSDLPKAGDVAGAKALEDAAHRIKVTVGSGDLGLADTRVDVRRMPSADDPNRMDIVFAVTEGVPVVIDQVLIRGNDYTKDKVIRREIALGPGDRMLEDRAERSKNRLENLDYFSRVNYALEPSPLGKNERGEEYRNLVYEVEEKNTGSFMVGVGASSVDSVYLSAEVMQPNFDLFAPGKLFRGAGQKGRAFVQWGPRIQTYEASVTEPHLFDRLLELTVEGHRRMRWFDEYNVYRTGASASLSYPVKFWHNWEPFGRIGVRYLAEYVQMDEVPSGTYLYDGQVVSLEDEESRYSDSWESVVRLFWSHDSRDSFRMPSSGSRSQIFGDLSAGGDVQFWRAGLSHRHYLTTWKRYRHVLMLGVRAETIDALTDDVPIFERMFLGGPHSVRGVRYRHVSPFATRSDGGSGIPWGGKTLFCANVEYTIPIVNMLRFAVFTDLGSVGPDTFDLDFSSYFAWSAGVGIRLDIPMFPIRLDLAAPFVKPDEADDEFFSFTVGYDF